MFGSDTGTLILEEHRVPNKRRYATESAESRRLPNSFRRARSTVNLERIMSLAIAKSAAFVHAYAFGDRIWGGEGLIEVAAIVLAHTKQTSQSDLWRDSQSALNLRPEAEQQLLDVGIPSDESPIHSRRKRMPDTPEDAARKFVIWARAVGVTGAHSGRRICTLYWECTQADHRRPVSDCRFLIALKDATGIRVGPSVVEWRKRIWVIEPAEPQLALPVAAPSSPALTAEAVDSEPKRVGRSVPEQEYNSPQLVQANAHYARRLGKARKQRGPRDVRWAA
jgi:hypothetical protein